MKEYIITLEISKVRERAKVIENFDTKELAEDWMLTTGVHIWKNETVLLKRQSQNRWWDWDFKTGQGWQPFEVQSVRLAREEHARQLEEAQVQIRTAAKEVNLLKAVLEAHGNIDWPIIE